MTGLKTNGHGGARLNWRQVRILYLRELRSAFRERTIVVNSVLIPLFLYPLILWAAFNAISFVHGQTEGFVSRTVIKEWPKDHPSLRGKFEREKLIQLGEPKGRSVPELETEVRDGRLDAYVEFLPVTNGVAANFETRITFNESKDRSASAKKRIRSLVDAYRIDWLKREAKHAGIDSAAWECFSIGTRNVASKRQMGSFVMGLMLPLMFTVMVAVGCIFPAVDTTAGERERNTWETLMSTSANRVSIVAAKYLYVTTLGGIAGLLNITALSLTLKPIFLPLTKGNGDVFNFSVPLGAIPIMGLAAVLLAGFVAAGMMLFASFARTFKEGQAMATPFYLSVLLPVIFLQSPGLKFTLPLALIPIANVTMMIRAAVSSSFPPVPIAVTILVSLAMIAACVRLAAFILKFEDVMLGSYSGSLKQFLKDRVLRRKPAAPPVAPSQP